MSGCASNPDVQLVELSKNTVVYDEIVRINNCGGKGDSEQTKSRDFATTVEFGVGVSAGYQSIVQGSLSAKYSEYRNTSVSQRLVAPPGTNMEFVLRWSDDVRAGNVQVNGKSGTYEVHIPISVEQVSGRDLGCGLSMPIQPTAPVAQSTQQSPAINVPVGSCDSLPVNAQDNLVVSLIASNWYVIEDFDNSVTPPMHKFLVKSGPANVVANSIKGQRAWHCSDERTAIFSAILSANEYKRNHPDHKVYGPDGTEIP